MRRLLVALALAAAPVCAAAAELTPNPLEPPSDERTPAQIEQQRLDRFLFKPITEVAKQGKDVRRVSFIDLFDGPSTPGITFEKQADGKVAMTVVSERGSVIDKATLKPEAWAYITAGEPKAGRRAPAKQKEMCHGTEAVIEAVQGGRVTRYDAAVCNGPADLAAMEYSRRLAQVALDSIPRCEIFREHARDTSWVLTECMRRSNRPAARNETAGNETNIRPALLDYALETSTEKRGPIESTSRRGGD